MIDPDFVDQHKNARAVHRVYHDRFSVIYGLDDYAWATPVVGPLMSSDMVAVNTMINGCLQIWNIRTSLERLA